MFLPVDGSKVSDRTGQWTPYDIWTTCAAMGERSFDILAILPYCDSVPSD